MKTPTDFYDHYEVVVVPFPFTDINTVKRRPALILSSSKHFNNNAEASIMAMITTVAHSSWPLDVVVHDLDVAGLPAPSIIRMKLFTLDHRLILKKIGELSKRDQQTVSKNFRSLFLIH
jgi:mRNA interferase MazF